MLDSRYNFCLNLQVINSLFSAFKMPGIGNQIFQILEEDLKTGLDEVRKKKLSIKKAA